MEEQKENRGREEELRVSLIVPVYNECGILPETLSVLSAYMEETFGEAYEILYADDGSTDGSAERIAEWKDPAVRVLRGERNRGKGNAVRRGMLAARGRIRVFTDCDLAYGAEAVGGIVQFLEAHPEADAAVGSRELHPHGYDGYGCLRRLLSRTYRSCLRILGGLRLSDSQSGLKAFRADAAERIFGMAETDGYAFDFEAILLGEKLGLVFAEYPARVVGNRPSHVRFFRDSLRMLRDIRRIRRRVRRLKTGEESAGET